jgi:FkbM family methyltransferase
MKTAHHFRDLLTPGSRLRYTAWRLLGGRTPITLSLQSGLQLRIRGLRSTDYGVAWDIYWRRCYQSPEPLPSSATIVDLGANVGYSCLWWCQEYPDANVTAFEPHPEHLKSIAGHLSANGLDGRVQVVPAAAGTADGFAYLTNAGSSSSVTSEQNAFRVRVADLFGCSLGPIDILKIDIEGGEYALLGDERFPSLNVRSLVVEWHGSPGREWCRERLEQMGYRTRTGTEDLPAAGLLWAYRK